MTNKLVELCHRQGGLISRQQALTVTTSYSLTSMVTSGELVRVFRGVFRLRSTAATPELLMRAAALFLRTDVIGCRESAALLLGMPVDKRCATAHVLTRLQRPSAAPSLVVHREEFTDDDVLLLPSGLAVTNFTRTAVDLARTNNRLDALAVLDAALRAHQRSGGRRGASLAQLRDTMAQHCRKPGIRQATELLGYIDPGAESAMESRTRMQWIDAQLPPPQTQVLVHTSLGIKRLDLADEEHQVGLEFDSFAHHSGVDAVRRDNRRHNALTEAGWLVFYAGPAEVYLRPQEFTEPIRAAIEHRRRQRWRPAA